MISGAADRITAKDVRSVAEPAELFKLGLPLLRFALEKRSGQIAHAQTRVVQRFAIGKKRALRNLVNGQPVHAPQLHTVQFVPLGKGDRLG